MQKIFIILALSALVFAGCNRESSICKPEDCPRVMKIIEERSSGSMALLETKKDVLLVSPRQIRATVGSDD